MNSKEIITTLSQHKASERGPFAMDSGEPGASNLYFGLGAALTGVGAGLTAMYFLDTARGARRRAVVSDKVSSFARKMPKTARVTAVDLANRTRGAWARATDLFASGSADDQVIEARVRSKLGRVVSHPHSVHVTSVDGHVSLDGVILSREVPELINCVTNIRGVRSVENRMREFDSPEGIPSLQGGRPREQRNEFMQQNWSPAARFVAGAIGASALLFGLNRRDLTGLVVGTAGALALTRSLTNTELARLVGARGGRSVVTVDKTINVDAPPDVVYALWSNFENFPRFMRNVLDVRRTEDGLSHWKIAGPAGVPVEWDAEITREIPGELLAWRSVEGSAVPNAGYVVFEANEDGGTEVSVRFSYDPPGGAIGHAFATVFGADPKSEMDADLMRMKSLLETGQLPHDAARPHRSEPGGDRVF